MNGVLFSKAKGSTTSPDMTEIFANAGDLRQYIKTLGGGPSIEQGEALSRQFLYHLYGSLQALTDPERTQMWRSKPDRTRVYAEIVMPAVAWSLGLEFSKERFTADYVMSKMSVRGTSVPLIYIESENEYSRADYEIEKLCSLNSPLRVLLTCTTKAVHVGGISPAHTKLRKWQSILRAHFDEVPDRQGVLAVVVASVSEAAVQIFDCAFGPEGDLLRPLERGMEIPLRDTAP